MYYFRASSSEIILGGNRKVRAKRVAVWCCKAFLAGCLAFSVMTLFCIVYYNVPLHHFNSDGSTDFKWEPDHFYSRGTEGFAFGKTNNDGFVNSIDYTEGMDINVLIMGSSQIEAYQVSQSESVTGRLNALLEDKTVYNIGVSGHYFLTCCCNLEAALEKYRPSCRVVVETSRIAFTSEELNSVLTGTFPEMPVHSNEIINFLFRNQFLKLIYHQIQDFMAPTAADNKETVSNTQLQSAEDSRETLNDVLSLLSRIAAQHRTGIIIVYHPTTKINSDGSLLLPSEDKQREVFANLCEKNGITFLDMTERFEYEYDVNHILPHGFTNSSVGSGHLNKYGHEMIADELHKIIESEESGCHLHQ